MKPRVAFDLDETLGIPKIHDNRMTGFHIRKGALSLLEALTPHFILCLWSVSNRGYVDKALAFGLGQYFAETYSWNELPVRWKDIRRLELAYLIDDNPYHREMAAQWGIMDQYIVVPEDRRYPIVWVSQVKQILFKDRSPA